MAAGDSEEVTVLIVGGDTSDVLKRAVRGVHRELDIHRPLPPRPGLDNGACTRGDERVVMRQGVNLVDPTDHVIGERTGRRPAFSLDLALGLGSAFLCLALPPAFMLEPLKRDFLDLNGGRRSNGTVVHNHAGYRMKSRGACLRGHGVSTGRDADIAAP